MRARCIVAPPAEPPGPAPAPGQRWRARFRLAGRRGSGHLGAAARRAAPASEPAPAITLELSRRAICLARVLCKSAPVRYRGIARRGHRRPGGNARVSLIMNGARRFRELRPRPGCRGRPMAAVARPGDGSFRHWPGPEYRAIRDFRVPMPGRRSLENGGPPHGRRGKPAVPGQPNRYPVAASFSCGVRRFRYAGISAIAPKVASHLETAVVPVPLARRRDEA